MLFTAAAQHNLKNGEAWRQLSVYLISIAFSIVFLLPLFWMVSTSLKTPDKIFSLPIQWLPQPIAWENYRKAFTVLPFELFYRNTLVITLSCIIGTLFSASLVAYGFARLNFAGKNLWFTIMLSTMMLPSQVTMIPIFAFFRSLGWVDSFKPLIVPSFFGGGAFNIFLLRQFFMTIPVDIEEAARIDGCSTFSIFYKIVLPLSKPVLTTITIFTFIAHWNDLMTPLIYINSLEKKTIAMGLLLFQGQYGTQWELLMAAATIALLPVLLLFFFLQRYFVEGIVMSGLKG